MSRNFEKGILQECGGASRCGGLGDAGAMELNANHLGLPIGCQTWPVRDMILKDLPGTLKTLAAAGFQAIEMCSPSGYSERGFGGLAKCKGSDLKQIINDAGLICTSSHFGLDELRKEQDTAIAWAKDLGLTRMLVATLSGPRTLPWTM